MGDLTKNEKAIIASISKEDIERCKNIIKKGLSVNCYIEALDTTPLEYALTIESSYELLKVLFDSSNDIIDIKDSNESLSKYLLKYIEKNEIKTVELLLKNNFDMNYENEECETALIKAVVTNNIEMIKLLLKFNVEINYKNQCGCIVLDYVYDDTDPEIFKLLVDNGVNRELLCKDLQPFENNVEILKTLYQKYYNINF